MDSFRDLVGFCPRNGGMVEWWNGGMAEWRNGGMAEWRNGKRNGGMAEWQTKCLPSLVLTTLFPPVWLAKDSPKRLAVLGPFFVNRKKVRSFTFPGILYMRTQDRSHRRCIYGQFKYLTNVRHTTINLQRHPMNTDGVCNARNQFPNSYRRIWILSVV